jgi:hypothetical protein
MAEGFFARLKYLFTGKKDTGERISVTVNKQAIVEIATMLNVQNYNLGVFIDTPAYKTDEFALQYMMKNNIMVVGYLMRVFGITPEEILENLKKEREDGFIQMSNSPHDGEAPESQKETEVYRGIEFT